MNDFFTSFSFEKVFFTQDTEYDESVIYFDNDQLSKLVETLKETGEYPAVYNQSTTGVGYYIIDKSDLKIENITDRGLRQGHFDFSVISIQSPKLGELTVNNDFFETKDFLLFTDNPADIFEKDKILISRAYVTIPTIYRYPFRVGNVHESQNNKHFSLFSRFEQSVDKFKLALASYSGVGVVDETSELLKKSKTKDSVTYVFDRQVLDVKYDHEELTVGRTYAKNHIVGEGLRIYNNTGKTGWWREIDWGDGLTLSVISDREDKINKVSELTTHLKIPNETFEVTENGIGPEGKPHINIKLIGSPEKQEAYWEYVKNRELETGTYLSDVADGNYENPLDLFFRGVLDKKSIVVRIDEDTVPYPERAVKFVRREAPVGATIIILYKKRMTEDTISASNQNHTAKLSSSEPILNAAGESTSW